jgi:hypothetical protein
VRQGRVINSNVRSCACAGVAHPSQSESKSSSCIYIYENLKKKNTFYIYVVLVPCCFFLLKRKRKNCWTLFCCVEQRQQSKRNVRERYPRKITDGNEAEGHALSRAFDEWIGSFDVLLLLDRSESRHVIDNKLVDVVQQKKREKSSTCLSRRLLLSLCFHHK